MKVLITSSGLMGRSGANLYVRDLALELRRQGHHPVVYVFAMGEVADELRSAGILVSTRLGRVARGVDVIHGHHFHPTLDAVQRLPSVPAIFVCHGHEGAYDQPPLHPRIRRYFGVSQICVERLRAAGISESQLGLMCNFVDVERFLPRVPLPARPSRALMFSNYASDNTYLPAVRAACAAMNLKLDVIGAGTANVHAAPERVLSRYDVVFAKGKCALEALTVGAAVVLCDFKGVGPMVTLGQLQRLQSLNFGYEALTDPLQPDYLIRQLQRYDPADARAVSAELRARAGVQLATRRLVDVYRDVRAERTSPIWTGPRVEIPTRRLKLGYWIQLRWLDLPASWRAILKHWLPLRLVHGWLQTVRSRLVGTRPGITLDAAR